jgi:hypothetical protein
MENPHDDRRSATWICFSLSLAMMSRASKKWIVNPWKTLMMTEEVLIGYVSV